MQTTLRRPQVSVLGSAEPGSPAFERAAEAGALLARLGITVVSGCGSPATRIAAERALAGGGLVLSIVPPDQMPDPDWPATIVRQNSLILPWSNPGELQMQLHTLGLVRPEFSALSR